LRVRALWWRLHRWIALALVLLLVPISLSGALLVWHDQLDALIHPGRYAVTGTELAQPSAYLANAAAALASEASGQRGDSMGARAGHSPEAGSSARAALGGSVQPAAVRFPAEDGWPVIVMARAPRAEGGPPRLVNVYLDPPTARVLDVVDFRASLIGWLHRFHENLTIPEYSGRAVVGWAGIGMLILALTGLWLWWPRGGALMAGLRWRRTAHTTANLHHLFGFWLALPLAVVSATGIYLGFPQTARQVMSSLAPMTPPGQRPGFGAVVREARLTPEAAVSAALMPEPGAQVAVIFLPIAGASTSGRDRARGAEQGSSEVPRENGPRWRVQLRVAGSGEIVTAMVDDASGAVERPPGPLAGDRAASWMRWIHDGSRGGPLWQVAVFLTGIAPAVFAVTGVVMWWRGRRARKAGATIPAAGERSLQAAE